MTRDEYLKSVLTARQIQGIKRAIKEKQPIFISHTSNIGKSCLRDYLESIGATVYEFHEMHVVEVHKKISRMIPNVLDEIED